ncbi:MAG: hypothetical protein MSS46_03325, partial [Oscillospiraceae bacterium]|nr:hypothetical protein [Oscillospiraceae bacterium]
RLYDFFLILTYLSVTSGHKISSYGSSFYSTIGGLFFLLSIFYGLVQFGSPVFYLEIDSDSAVFPQIRAGCCNAKEKIYTCLALKEELFPYKY